MNQENGDFLAEGNVSSSQKQQKGSPKSGMLPGDEPVQATAPSMISTGRNQHIRYEGGAVVWQGANRIKGETVEIDRENRRLVASGKVETQLVEKSDKQKAKTGGVTVVRSAGLVYTEADRIAHYTGGATMIRPRMTMKSLELRAVLADKDAESSLETAYADGKVEIVQQDPGRSRTGTSEHAEYYSAEDKLILRGGNPQLVDSVKGTTRGQELTYFAADDRLLVNGAPDRPATSRLRRK
jgi:lipopolysaccharide export system protein LptA